MRLQDFPIRYRYTFHDLQNMKNNIQLVQDESVIACRGERVPVSREARSPTRFIAIRSRMDIKRFCDIFQNATMTPPVSADEEFGVDPPPQSPSHHKAAQPIYRRRRKRARSEAFKPQNSSSSSIRRRRAIPTLEDDSAFLFGTSNGEHEENNKNESNGNDDSNDRVCLPLLLEERRLGNWKRRQAFWQTKALLTCHYGKTRQWRSFASRSIPFTHLDTPASDAVLALERSGSYVLSLGGKDGNDGSSSLALALRFYGVPSPAAVQARSGSFGRAFTTPLLQTTPLLHAIAPVDESVEESIFNFRRAVSPANTPVKVLVSNDWRVGVALLLPVQNPSWTEDGPSGTLVLFSLDTNHSDPRRSMSTFQCANVRIGAGLAFTTRNLLWRVHGIPYSSPNVDDSISDAKRSCDAVWNLPGYMFLNDEEDGYRMTWVTDSWNVQEAGCENKLPTSPLANGIESTQAIVTVEDTWEACRSERYVGSRRYEKEKSDIQIAFEAFLHVDVLLNEITSRRKNFSNRHPEYYYNLISVTCGGRIAELVITFILQNKPGALGVFVRVDLFTGRFQEQEWIKSVGTHDIFSLRSWANAIALNRRMRQMRAGPYSINAKHCIDWGRLCKESYFDMDQEDDFDPSIWKPSVGSAQTILAQKIPKQISFASLYPDCDLITNQAVTSKSPVPSLVSRSPIQLVYG